MIRQLAMLLLLISATGFAQRKPMHGKIVSGEAVVPNVYIINKATGTETRSNAQGLFSLDVQLGDQLAVYSTTVETRDFLVTADALSHNPYVMSVDPKATELNEVVITDMNPEKMGLVPKGQKQYTPAERRLKQAKSGMGLELLINALSGRLKMLKQNVQTERRVALMESIDGLFTDDELTGFGIPRETARGFLYYAIEDDRVADAIQSGNASLVKLLLMELSQKYLKLQEQQ